MQVTRIGLDLTKHVFQVHGVDEYGKVVIRKQLSRSKVLAYFAQLPVCRIGIEACGSAHYWGRELQKIGHEVRLMAMHLIKPYRTKQKNDLNDAEAICKAVSRPHMRFVPIKAIEQQYDRQIVLLVRQNEAAKRLMHLDGIGPITATAVVATVGDATAFPHGRQFAAWLGLVPKQFSTEGKSVLGRITKRSNVYLRTLLIHGARVVLRYTTKRTDAKSQWVEAIRHRRGTTLRP